MVTSSHKGRILSTTLLPTILGHFRPPRALAEHQNAGYYWLACLQVRSRAGSNSNSNGRHSAARLLSGDVGRRCVQKRQRLIGVLLLTRRTRGMPVRGKHSASVNCDDARRDRPAFAPRAADWTWTVVVAADGRKRAQDTLEWTRIDRLASQQLEAAAHARKLVVIWVPLICHNVRSWLEVESLTCGRHHERLIAVDAQ